MSDVMSVLAIEIKRDCVKNILLTLLSEHRDYYTVNCSSSIVSLVRILQE